MYGVLAAHIKLITIFWKKKILIDSNILYGRGLRETLGPFYFVNFKKYDIIYLKEDNKYLDLNI